MRKQDTSDMMQSVNVRKATVARFSQSNLGSSCNNVVVPSMSAFLPALKALPLGAPWSQRVLLMVATCLQAAQPSSLQRLCLMWLLLHKLRCGLCRWVATAVSKKYRIAACDCVCAA